MSSLPEADGLHLRAYQAEMLEASLKDNIIVVQDTGSGKTHIALARAAAELETCGPEKLVWFLAPTVALCEQQFQVFRTNLPAYETQLLSGRDNVDHWTDQATWDAVLRNVRVVLSTHQVLLDALDHGFVKMRKIALLIFDEAHHCTGNHPANRILANHYLPKVHEQAKLPGILGLSASPVMKAKASTQALEEIERNMSAVARTPKMHRPELLRFVHIPQLLRIDYLPTPENHSLLYSALKALVSTYDISKDPFVLDLIAKSVGNCSVNKKLEEICVKRNTYCLVELKSLLAKYEATSAELGPSVADWCLRQSIHQFQKLVQSSDQLLEWSLAEKEHLQQSLSRLPLPEDFASLPMSFDQLSPKLVALVNLLASEVNHDLSCIMFVEQRVWVAAIAELLSIHPQVQGRISIGTFVGNSMSAKRRSNLAGLVEPKNQQGTLDKFKAGDTNLIIATSVLEEGIDVSDCHLVVCFESPKNLKSFVQRRGRARRMQSKYIIFLAKDGNTKAPAMWEKLEKDMKAAYENDLRRVRAADENESLHEAGERIYEIASTGAKLTLENSLAHLYHFCGLLGSGPYIDTRPQFTFEEDNCNISARVLLPISVDPTLRVAHSLQVWRTERMASKDAAFESYKMLHLNGLVSDNLLPIKKENETPGADLQKIDKAASMMEVSPALDPWCFIAECQQQNPSSYYRTVLEFQGINKDSIFMDFYLPVQAPNVPEITLFWNESKRIKVISHFIPALNLSREEVKTMRGITQKILRSAHSRVGPSRDDFIWLLVPGDGSRVPWNHVKLLQWDVQTSSVEQAHNLINRGMTDLDHWGQVIANGDSKRWFVRHIDCHTSDQVHDSQFALHLTRTPKRRDFVYPIPLNQQENESFTRTEVYPAIQCSVDMLPGAYSVCAMLVPSILYYYELYFTANTLRLGLLKPLSLEPEHLPLLVQAMTTSSTGNTAHYQRLEFFGDCIVKFIASLHLMAENLKWPESFLTEKKGKIVSNGFFARATLSCGLDKFIIRKRFTGNKWRPHYADDALLNSNLEERTMISSKNLADVIESLVGVSYLIGGFPKAFVSMKTLLPLEPWKPVSESNETLYTAIPIATEITGLGTVETLIGYTFSKKMALLEALTHPSYKGPLANCSYERLEFLGDAVLDYIISKRLYAHTPEISHAKMHGIRTAMANAAFLAFRMFETTVEEERTVPPDMHKEIRHRCLWQFLRSEGTALVVNRDVAIAQYDVTKERLRSALSDEPMFPWHILAEMDAPKFLSDIVESVIGAIYVDSRGNIEACENFVRKLGILGCLERILQDEVDCLHPKERLGILAVEKKVQYTRVMLEQSELATSEGKIYRCQVKVGGNDLGGVTEGIKRLNAETIAAWYASKILLASKETETHVDMEQLGHESGLEEEKWFDAEEGGIILAAEIDTEEPI